MELEPVIVPPSGGVGKPVTVRVCKTNWATTS